VLLRAALAFMSVLSFLGPSVPFLYPAQSAIPWNFPRHDWEPTVAPVGAHYVGSTSCIRCHFGQAGQLNTAMAHALTLPNECAILREHPRMSFRIGQYRYDIRREGSRSIYTVTNGRRSISVPILWALGYSTGTVGQTYLLQYGGHFVESEVSYFDRLGRLELTLGHLARQRNSLETALGSQQSPHDLWLCLGCHATGAVDQSGFRKALIPGIRCEGCHGPGDEHISAVKRGDLKHLHIFNPAKLSSESLNDFCGSCHRTLLEEQILGFHGVQTVRFQGYRLARSLCYSSTDRRISCTACHDPHMPLVRDRAFYDKRCVACHRGTFHTQGYSRSRMGRSCPVAKDKCVNCHMPKVEIPGSHFAFTDHWIRIVKDKAPYPE
jgi:hypothetical protein